MSAIKGTSKPFFFNMFFIFLKFFASLILGAVILIYSEPELIILIASSTVALVFIVSEVVID